MLFLNTSNRVLDKDENIPYYDNLSEAFLSLRNFDTHPHLEVVKYDDMPNFTPETKPFRVNAYIVGLITDGEYSFVIDDREYEFKRGTLYFLSPWHTRSYKIIERWKGYVLAFTPQFISNVGLGTDISNFAFFAPGKSVVLSIKDQPLEELTSLMQQMHTENKSSAENKHQLLFHYIHILLHKCENLLHQTATDTILANDEVLNRFHHHMQSYFRQLETNAESLPLTINFVAEQMNLHPHYLSDIIKQKTGKTATQLIRERIVYEAQVLLKHTNKSVSEIAYHLKFEDNSNFTKFFKAQLQLTPKEFREQNISLRGKKEM
jgi:AraC family transcriptional activator of pobA